MLKLLEVCEKHNYCLFLKLFNSDQFPIQPLLKLKCRWRSSLATPQHTVKTLSVAKSTAHTNTVLCYTLYFPKNLAQNMCYVKYHVSVVLIVYIWVEQEINSFSIYTIFLPDSMSISCCQSSIM